MSSESFQRLPQHIQDLISSGLEDEITTAFEKIEAARTSKSLDESEVRFLEGDIIRVSELYRNLTGQEAAL